MHTNQRKSQREISKKLNVDRKTVRRYLREYEQKKKELLKNQESKDMLCSLQIFATGLNIILLYEKRET
jgi:predicted transcriptional regulator